MGMVKRFLEDVADELGELDITSPSMQAEASKRWGELVGQEDSEEQEMLEFFKE